MQDETGVVPVVENLKPKLSEKERVLLLFTLGICLLFAVSHVFKVVAHKNEVDAIRAEMQVLADAGKPEAILWVLKNGDSSEANLPEELRAAAETGHPESMYMYALLLGYKSQPVESEVWMRKAAAVGYPQAVQTVHEMKAPLAQNEQK